MTCYKLESDVKLFPFAICAPSCNTALSFENTSGIEEFKLRKQDYYIINKCFT